MKRTNMKRLPTFDAAIRFLETQLEAIDERRAKVAAALDGLRFVSDGSPAAPLALSTTIKAAKRFRSSGSTEVVLASVRDGHNKLAAIAKDAKLEESAARTAVLALEQAGKVRREGKGSLTRYVAA